MPSDITKSGSGKFRRKSARNENQWEKKIRTPIERLGARTLIVTAMASRPGGLRFRGKIRHRWWNDSRDGYDVQPLSDVCGRTKRLGWILFDLM